MSKYDKSVSINREQEGIYHRREYETSPSRHSSYKNQPITTYSTQQIDNKGGYTSDEDNFEEWTVSKRKVNHKTRQVETRVSRQLLVEDGKVIADSGPQVTTRIKEDNKVEECEKEKTPRNKSKFEALECAPESNDSTGRVLGEKKEIQRKSREVREENMQYHDERFKELTGQDVHRRAIKAPHELITINDKDSTHSSKPRGKMVHYSNKGKKYQDTDEILEVAKLAIDGSITKEVKRTKHHEEFSEDEKPDETGEGEELRRAGPKVERSSRRHADYVNDFDDTATPSCSSDEEYHETGREATRTKHRGVSSSKLSAGSRRHHTGDTHDDEAFPRYKIDPLLNSLNDNDYRPTSASSGGRNIEHSHERSNSRHRADSSDDDEDHHRHHRHHTKAITPMRQRSPSPVDIPEEYRVHRSSGKTTTSQLSGSGHRERSFSPNSKLSHKSSLSRSHKEDAGVQAHLTDEEIERKSMSSSDLNTHEKTTRKLQRQSTGGSRRNYYFGDSKTTSKTHQRSPSIHSSSSSSSLSDPKERMRKQGVQSRDSGFRSPHHHHRTITPSSTGSQQQIYSVSNKQKARQQQQRSMGAVSPTPTTGSVGQRSVKTTTTTMSAGLADRPLSRNERSTSTKSRSSPTTSPTRPKRSSDGNKSSDKRKQASSRTIPTYVYEEDPQQESAIETYTKHPTRSRMYDQRQRNNWRDDVDDRRHEKSFDNVSISSLGPNATTIKVPYRRENDGEIETGKESSKRKRNQELAIVSDGESIKGISMSSEMSFQNDLANLNKRIEDMKKREDEQSAKQHFDYKTIVANVEPAPSTRHHQVIDTYNVRVIEHNSPFYSEPLSSKNQLANSVSKLNLLGENGSTNEIMDNNNEANFVLNNFIKNNHTLSANHLLNEAKDDDQVSLISSCSLRSSRTYDVRTFHSDNTHEQDLQHIDDQLKQIDQEIQRLENERLIKQESNQERYPSAWIFDLKDGSSTAIETPARAKRAPTPKVDSKTEELAKSRGGQSYYLELVERDANVEEEDKTLKDSTESSDIKRQSSPSISALYTRWNSQGNIPVATNNSKSRVKPIANEMKQAENSSRENHRSRQIVPAGIIYDDDTRPIVTSASNCNLSITQTSAIKRRLSPLAGSSLANKSKSSSCLLTTPSTRCNKYSIYGGLKRADGSNKPVPRLSYSRTIGPKSQRQIDAQPKTPSRYLKLK